MKTVRRVLSACAYVLVFALPLPFAPVEAATLGSERAASAYRALSAGQYEAAVGLYGTAIESRELLPEELANALLNKALAEQHLQRHQAAIDDYEKALELDAMSAQLRATVLYNRGLSYHKLGDLPLAIEDYTSALLLDATLPQAFFSRGNALRESGQLLFALSDYERALKYNHPDKARVHYYSALTYETLRRPGEARKALQDALSVNPQHVAARKKLSEISEHLSVVEPASDPILTGSIGALGGTVLHKLDVSVAVEPTEALLAETVKIEQTATIPVVGKIQDRLASETYDGTVKVAVPQSLQAEPEKQPVVSTTGPETPLTDQPDTQIAAVEPQGPAPVEISVDAPLADGWAVQLTSASSEDAARSTWAKLQRKHSILAGLLPTVVRADLGSKGIFYRVRLHGFSEQEAAKTKCKAFKRQGVACYVSRAGS